MITALPRIFLIVLLCNICSIFRTSAQKSDHELAPLFYKIDSLALDDETRKAVDLINGLVTKTREEGSVGMQVKAVMYRNLFQSYLNGNTLLPLLNAIRKDADSAKQPAKGILQSLLGQFYWFYYQQNRYAFQGRTTIAGELGDDVSTWPLSAILAEMRRNFQLSIKDTARLQNTSISILSPALSGDSSNRQLRPTLYDLLAHRALDVYIYTQNNSALGDTALSAAISRDIRTIFGSLLNYHLKQGNNAAYLALKLKEGKFASGNFMGRIWHDPRDSQSLKFLEDLLTKAKGTIIYPDILVEMAALYRNGYLPDIDLKTRQIKAFELAEQASKLPGELSADNARSLMKEILTKSLSINIRAYEATGKPIEFYFSYKNIDSLYLGIYRIPVDARYRLDLSQQQYGRFLKQHRAERSWSIGFKDPKDYLDHSFQDYMEPLPVGKYVMIVRDRPLADTAFNEYMSAYAVFQVTGMTVRRRTLAANQEQYQVLSSVTGRPLKGAQVKQMVHRQNESGHREATLDQTDENGFALPQPYQYISYSYIISGQDTIVLSNNESWYGDRKPQKRVIFYTDRSIYRPGQTIFFKGLSFTEQVGKSQLLLNDSVAVSFLDVNGQEIQQASFVTNEYGTFHGSFLIPQGKLNGYMSIRTKNGDGSISVRVEEYRRPTFEVTFDRLRPRYKPNDTITIKGRATAFAGYAISGATVSFRARKSGKDIAKGTVMTAGDGSFSFKIYIKDEEQDDYDIYADVTDITGETRSANTYLTAGKDRISLFASAPDELFLGNMADSIKVVTSGIDPLVSKPVLNGKLYRLKKPVGNLRGGNIFEVAPENYRLEKNAYEEKFPYRSYGQDEKVSNWPAEETNVQFTVDPDGGSGSLKFRQQDLAPGYYKAVFTATGSSGDTARKEHLVRIFHQQPDSILRLSEWLVRQQNGIKTNEQAIFRVAGPSGAMVWYEVCREGKPPESKWITVDEQQQLIKISPLPGESQLSIQFRMFFDGREYQSNQNVYIIDPRQELDVRYLTFRDHLQPGQKETWKIQLTNKAGEKQQAELMTTLYDAALDKLRQHYWDPYDRPRYRYQLFEWDSETTAIQREQLLWPKFNTSANIRERQYEQINDYGYRYYAPSNSIFYDYLETARREGEIRDSTATAELLGTLKKSGLVYGIVTDRSGIIVKGARIYINDKYMVSTNVYGIYALPALKGAKLTVKYGGKTWLTTRVTSIGRLDIPLMLQQSYKLKEIAIRGYQKRTREQTTGSSFIVTGKEVRDVPANGPVLQGKVAGLAIQQTPRYGPSVGLDEKTGEVKVRTNFNETAFFFPQLHTDANGEISMEFTMPESLTKYKLMGMAHTKDLRTMTFTREVIVQKPVAISMNAPRFFREGDTLILSAKLNNLSGKQLKGDASLELTDELSGNRLQLFTDPAAAIQKYTLKNRENLAMTWKVVIPEGIAAITYKAITRSGKFADGEQRTIPVLPNSTVITETLPLNVRGGSRKTFVFEKLLSSDQSRNLRNLGLSLEFTPNPAWYAIQSLPYLMEYPYECAEQTFSRFYANSIATGIISSSPGIRAVFEKWQKAGTLEKSVLERNPEFKAVMLAETSWDRSSTDDTERKKRMAALFDDARMKEELAKNFKKLRDMQLSNGAFPWFNGMNANRYITQHIVLGLSQLRYLNLIDEKAFPELRTILNKAYIYLDREFAADFSTKNAYYYLPLHYLYARSYSRQVNTDTAFKKAVRSGLETIQQQWPGLNTYQQGLAALVFYRNGRTSEALKIVKSLKERSEQDEESGMSWPDNQPGWWWYQSPIETQALMIEVFDEVAKDQKAVEELKLWLLKNKQTNDWRTTKATTAATYALLMRGQGLLTDAISPEITLGGKSFGELGVEVPQPEAGTGYQKITIPGKAIRPEMGRIAINNPNPGTGWGGLFWQYQQPYGDMEASSADGAVKISRQLFLQDGTGPNARLIPLDKANGLKTGDMLRVRIEVHTDRDMEYVHIKDLRSSGLEPVNQLSGYRYQDRLGYYESTKDASTNFFIDYMGKGAYVLEYPVRVNIAGSFSNGITTLQCMYAPEFSAHSKSLHLKIDR